LLEVRDADIVKGDHGVRVGLMQPVFRVKQGKRYGCATLATTPTRSIRSTFTATVSNRHVWAGQPTSGVIKDVVVVGGYQEVEIDFVADNPGLTLLHCRQQVHGDFGFHVPDPFRRFLSQHCGSLAQNF
jgi:hypothetical protein